MSFWAVRRTCLFETARADVTGEHLRSLLMLPEIDEDVMWEPSLTKERDDETGIDDRKEHSFAFSAARKPLTHDVIA